MARKTTSLTITDEGRDKGKTFVLTEMPVFQAEKWACRVLLALMSGNVELPDNFDRLGMAGLAEIGIKAMSGLKWEAAEPLLDEMLSCIQVMPEKSNPSLIRPIVISVDIEELSTIIKIRAEIWKLHTDFLKAVTLSNSAK